MKIWDLGLGILLNPEYLFPMKIKNLVKTYDLTWSRVPPGTHVGAGVWRLIVVSPNVASCKRPLFAGTWGCCEHLVLTENIHSRQGSVIWTPKFCANRPNESLVSQIKRIGWEHAKTLTYWWCLISPFPFPVDLFQGRTTADFGSKTYYFARFWPKSAWK